MPSTAVVVRLSTQGDAGATASLGLPWAMLFNAFGVSNDANCATSKLALQALIVSHHFEVAGLLGSRDQVLIR